MKIHARNLSYIFVVSIYFLSLLPSDKVTSHNATDQLREAIQALQVLQENTYGSVLDVNKSLASSIRTIQNLAGLTTVFYGHHAPIESKRTSLLTISFRYLYIPVKEFNTSVFNQCIVASYPELLCLYCSPDIPPDLPPPVSA